VAAFCAAVAVWAGCAIIVGETTGELSDNLALADKGAVANRPEFNDGNQYTSAMTTSSLVARDDPNWMEAEKYSVAEVTLPKPTRIHRIVVYSKDLNRNLQTGMYVSVEYLNEKDEWVTVRRWDRNPVPKIIKASLTGTAKKVRLQIRRPPSLFGGGGGAGGGGGGIVDRGDRAIYELEVYQYLPKTESAPTGG
jgi:hypothetical protein